MHSNTTSKEDEKIGNTSYPDEDKISIKNQSLEDAHITINIMKTIEQMNMAQISIDPARADEITDYRHKTSDMYSSNRYDL